MCGVKIVTPVLCVAPFVAIILIAKRLEIAFLRIEIVHRATIERLQNCTYHDYLINR